MADYGASSYGLEVIPSREEEEEGNGEAPALRRGYDRPSPPVGSIAQDTSRILRDLLSRLSPVLVHHFMTRIHSSGP
jgi:hypothetical protein